MVGEIKEAENKLTFPQKISTQNNFKMPKIYVLLYIIKKYLRKYWEKEEKNKNIIQADRCSISVVFNEGRIMLIRQVV